uniref:FBA_2 domain-containing protein n=1 Tax=Caenorhabditis tropicalis TaxID=1561998 RepID=A0A1I7UTC3_9PELO
MDPERISLSDINWPDQDLNVFLRSWQEGKTNRNLKLADLRTNSERDVKEVLKGCGGRLMDPRNTKFKFRDSNKWIYGGIHIRRKDGRLAVIQNNGFYYFDENQVVSRRQVEEYVDRWRKWNSEERSNTWYGEMFIVYIF